MDTRQLEYILTIVDEKNLSKAAERLFITQSALSQQIAKLKKEGLPPLFVQHHRQMELTDAGKIYVNGARTILKLEKDASEALNNLSSNRIRTFQIFVASYIQSLFLTGVLPKLHHAFPRVEIRVHTLLKGQSYHKLESGEADLLLIPSLRSAHDSFRFTLLHEEELVLTALPGFIRSSSHSIPLVLPEPDTHLRKLCDNALTTWKEKYDIYGETDDISTALKLVLMGECAAILPRRLVTEPELEVYSFPIPFSYHLTAVSRKDIHFPPIDQTIQEFLKLL